MPVNERAGQPASQADLVDVAALVTATVTRNGKTYQDQQVFVFHVNDQGKVSEAWVASDTEQLKKSLES